MSCSMNNGPNLFYVNIHSVQHLKTAFPSNAKTMKKTSTLIQKINKSKLFTRRYVLFIIRYDREFLFVLKWEDILQKKIKCLVACSRQI